MAACYPDSVRAAGKGRAVMTRPIWNWPSSSRSTMLKGPLPFDANGLTQLRLLFLDKRNQLIADEIQQTGTIDHTPVHPRRRSNGRSNYRRPH